MKRGPYKTNKILYEAHKASMVRLRQQGYGYGTIAKMLNIPPYLVRSVVQNICVDHGSATTKGMLFNIADKPFDSLSKVGRRAFLLRKRGHQCEKCKLTQWNGYPIPIELHNHRASEDKCLLLCPNCHSQTDDWRGRGKRKPK